MRELVKMVVVLTLLSAGAGGLLAAVRNGTMEKIEYQKLKFLKAPAVKQILAGATNDPINDKFKLKNGKKDISCFVGEFNGKKDTVAFESFAKGFGGELGLMVGFNVDTDKLVGICVTTHSETPGMGARAKDTPDLVTQFKGLPINDPFKVKPDGGQIDALSGATITSRAVCRATTKASELYMKLKPKIKEGIASLK